MSRSRRRDVAQYSDEQRAGALELADEVGVAEAARRLGIAEGTLKSWRSREGRSGPPAGQDGEDWAARRERSARQSLEVVSEAIAAARKHLAAGEASKAQSAMVSAGIASDKADAMIRAAAEHRAQEVRVAEGEAQLLAAVLEAVVADVGLPSGAVAPLTRWYLGQAAEGTVTAGSADPGDVRAARRALELHVLEHVDRDRLAEEARRRGVLRDGPAELPPGPPEVDVGDEDVSVESEGSPVQPAASARHEDDPVQVAYTERRRAAGVEAWRDAFRPRGLV